MSAVKTILVHVPVGEAVTGRLRTARRVAERLQAALHVLYAVDSLLLAVPLEIAATAGAVVVPAQELDERRRAEARERAHQAAGESGWPFVWHESGDLSCHAFVQQARLADLLVLGQDDPAHGDSGVPADFVETVLCASGRPALVLPWVGVPTTVGDTVLVAWKDTPEAARAVSAALPWMQRARQVHVATWGEPDEPAVSAPLGLDAFLRAHGVQARFHHGAEQDSDAVGEQMQSLAADLGADLVVMGCYGHSRVRELVLGGASRTLLRSMAQPVLMSH